MLPLVQFRKARKIREKEYRRKVFVIQAFFRGNTNRLTSQLAKRLLRNRKSASLSAYALRLFANVDAIDFSYKPYADVNDNVKLEKYDLASRPELLYQCPGIRQNTALFESALEKNCVLCLGRKGFGPEDCMLLCTVLRHPLCKTQRLVFDGVDGRGATFEFDLIQAVGKAVSLRSIVIAGGMWRPDFLVALFETVQKVNPRVVEVIVEDLRLCCMSPLEVVGVSSSSGKLVSDFFNYSVPGLRVLSLHGVGLADDHISDLVTGLSVNSSITNVVLSKNLIEDGGFCGIVKAISSNRRSLVAEIDLAWNIITGLDWRLIESLKKYSNPVFGKTLKVSLQHNHIRFYIDVGDEFRDDLLLVYDIDPSFAGPKPTSKRKRRHAQRVPGIEHSKSAALLSPVKPPAQVVNKKMKVKFKSKPIIKQGGQTGAGLFASSTSQF